MTDKVDGPKRPLTLYARAGRWAIQPQWKPLRTISEGQTGGLGYRTTPTNQVARAQMSGPMTISDPGRDRHGFHVEDGRAIALPVKRNQSE